MAASVPPPKRVVNAAKSGARVSSPPPPLTVRAATDGAPPSTQRRSYRQCFELFIAEARGVAADEVVVFRGDASLALSNVRIGLDNLAPHLSDAPSHLPRVNVDDVTSAADVARAVVYAGMLVPTGPATNDEIRVRLKRMLPKRAQVLGIVRTLVERKTLPERTLSGVGAKRGPRAMAQDAVRLADALSAHAAAIQGMHPFSVAEIDQLRDDGEWLLEALRPVQAKRRKAARDNTPAGDRDRLWTLLHRRHETLRKVAYYFHGDAFDAVVPPLQSRVKVQLADEEIDAPAPAPQPVG